MSNRIRSAVVAGRSLALRTGAAAPEPGECPRGTSTRACLASARLASFLAAIATGLTLVQPAWATVTAGADNRSGTITAFDGSGDPVQGGYLLDPGDIYDPITFNQCLADGTYQACLSSMSSWLGLGPGNSTTGFKADSLLTAVKPNGGGFAISDEFIQISLVVSGLVGGSVSFHFFGVLFESFADATVTLSGPGVNLLFNSTTSWDQYLNLVNGTYTLTIDANAVANGTPPQTKAIDYAITLEQGSPPVICGNGSCEAGESCATCPQDCGFCACGSPGAGSCFAAHSTIGCDDAACCNSVCAVDPVCCAHVWDDLCVDAAASLCPISAYTEGIINPATGHRHRLLTPKPWLASEAFAESIGARLVTINDGLENQFIRCQLAENVPTLPAHSVWTGLSDQGLEGAFVWASGQPVNFVNWSPGEPNDAGNEDFVQLYADTGRWNDLPADVAVWGATESEFTACGPGAGSCFVDHGPGCDDESCCHVTCEIDAFCCDIFWDGLCVETAQVVCAPNPVAGPYVNPATGHRYYLLEPGAWSEAQERAQQLGGYLAVVGSAAENEWIRLNLVNNTPAGPTRAWIGLHDQLREGSFQWVDFESVAYTNWLPGQPDNSNNEDHVEMYEPSTGLWNDLPNGFSIRAVVEVPCTGDFNADGVTDGSDLGQILGAWGTGSKQVDINQDGVIDGGDVGLLLSAWGPCPASNCCANHAGVGCDQPGCTACVCELDAFCCDVMWDTICAVEAGQECVAACQCS